MIVTTLEGYALKALIYIAGKEDKRATIKEISEENRISFPYILRICSMLRQKGILESIKGRNGGYVLSRDPFSISLFEIISAVHRQTVEIKCDYGEKIGLNCFQSDCISMAAWEKIKVKTDELFLKIKLSDLIERS
jgi:Rrf2 family iron-sulfur cluster assembly transcriptional regulator